MKHPGRVAVISISIPDTLLDQAEGFIARRAFAGRSELARAAIRDYIALHDNETRPGERTATLILVYPHGHERVFSTIRHNHLDIVRTAIHSHSREQCVELFVLEGDSARIRSFADMLRTTREALRVSLVYTDMGQEPSGKPHAHAH